jgi:hypothetical protein
MTIPEITEVKRLTIKPGDRIIVRCEMRLTEYDADYISHFVREHLGIGTEIPVLILDAGISLEVLNAPS